jgi:predicted metal-dependent hydrolase
VTDRPPSSSRQRRANGTKPGNTRTRKSIAWEHPGFPALILTESLRAKGVRLRVTLESGLEVITPQGFDRGKLPEILQAHSGWINQAIDKIKLQKKQLPSRQSDTLPTRIVLNAIDETWLVQYQPSPQPHVSVVERPRSVLLVRGPGQEPELITAALRAWLMKKANAWLSRWALDVADELGLPCRNVTVRNQKTRLGSCTSDRRLSLNAKLLFFPEKAVRYVLVHELCHTIQMNHSPAFWKEVEKRHPDYRRSRLQARAAWRALPAWAHVPR